MEQKVRVLAVCEAEATAAAMEAVAADEPRIDLGLPVRPGVTSVALCAGSHDIVVVDASASVPLGETLSEIRRIDATVRVVVYGDPDEPGLVAAVLAAGGSGVLPSARGPDVMREAILRAHAG